MARQTVNTRTKVTTDDRRAISPKVQALKFDKPAHYAPEVEKLLSERCPHAGPALKESIKQVAQQMAQTLIDRDARLAAVEAAVVVAEPVVETTPVSE